MNRYDITVSPQSPHFIGSWIIDPLSICQRIIEFFEAKPERHLIGTTTGNNNIEAKKTTDISILPRDVGSSDFLPIREYLSELMSCYRDYAEQWPFLRDNMGSLEMGPFNIQRYEVGDHFQAVHTERADFSSSNRALAWMTYLNDVEEGGATSFVHYNLDMQPKAGLTLIWPVDWTHAHRGNIVTHGQKYIITGWLLFPPK